MLHAEVNQALLASPPNLTHLAASIPHPSQIFGQGAMASPMIALKGPLMNKKDYSSNFPLKHAQKDMRFALGLGDKVGCRSRRDA